MRSYFPMGIKFPFGKWISSKYPLYNIVPIVNNTVLRTQEFVKRVDLMISVLTTKKGGHKETLWGDGYIYHLIVVIVSWVHAYVQIH